jgi:hypothetical protein
MPVLRRLAEALHLVSPRSQVVRRATSSSCRLPLAESSLHPDPRDDADDRFLGRLYGGGVSRFDRVLAAEASKQQYERNPMARRALRIDVDYAVGAAVRIRVNADDDALEAALQAELDQWAKACRLHPSWWQGLAFRIFTESELGIRFGAVPGYALDIRPIPTSTLLCEALVDAETGDVVGMVMQGGAEERRYRVVNSLSPWGHPGKLEPTEDLLWWARDAWCGPLVLTETGQVINEPRGVPELLSLLTRLRWEDDILRASVKRVKSGIRWFWQVIGSGMSEPELKAKQQEFEHAPADGSVLYTNEKTEWKSLHPDLGAYETTAFQRGLRASIAGGAGHPLHWHGDGGDANLATATAMDGPAFRQMQRFQGELIEIFTDLVTEVTRRMSAAGRVRAISETELMSLSWDFGLPAIDSRDYERGTRSVLQAQTVLDGEVSAGRLSERGAQRAMVDIQRRILGLEHHAEDLTDPEESRDERRDEKVADMYRRLPPPGATAPDDEDTADRKPKGLTA